jgi:hypothetical protein
MSFLNGRTFEHGQIVLDMLSTFWGLWFPDRMLLKNELDGMGQLYYETYLKTLETFACASKETVPTFALSNWKFLTLKDSDKLTADALKYKYGDAGRVYGNAGNYGDQRVTPHFSYPIDPSIANCSHLYNRLIDPSLVLIQGQDYSIDSENSLIHFMDDPTKNALIPVREVIDDTGVVVDREIGLWASNVQIDESYIYTHFGYVFNVWLKSSDFYRQFISALWDNLYLGPSKSAVKLVLSALTGIPFAKGDETVEKILVETQGLTIITNQNVYTFKPTATALVAEGDVLTVGQELVDSVRVIEPRNTTDWAGFLGISLGERFLGFTGLGPLFFENKLVDLDYVGVDIEGRAIVRFDIRGWSDDVENYWKTVHADGIQNKTLAEYLDLRANPILQPDQRDLPSQINPFLFVMNNLFKNNLYVISLSVEDFADGAPGLNNIVHLYKYLPPHTTYIMFLQMPTITDQYDTAGMQDTVSFMHAVEPIHDSFYVGSNDDYVAGLLRDLGPTFKFVPENCR